MDLVERMLGGERLALAKLMTKVENSSPDLAQIMSAIYPHTGKATIIGITGPPGAGKSTLTDKLIGHYREQQKTVGVVAVDPSSPFTGGAVLGDRVRMMRHAADEGVFIRSLGTRGSQGGLSRATKEFTKLYDAFGKDIIIVETVGVGQTELDIMELAHTTVVVLVPEAGDTIQTMKAGLTEIADIFVVNKADREGAMRIKREIETMVEIGKRENDLWQIPTLLCVATKNEGVAELAETIGQHMETLENSPKDPDRQMNLHQRDVRELIVSRFSVGLKDRLKKGLLEPFANDLLTGRTNPYSVAMELMKDRDLLKRILDDQ